LDFGCFDLPSGFISRICGERQVGEALITPASKYFFSTLKKRELAGVIIAT
jgi:hypothetical protein